MLDNDSKGKLNELLLAISLSSSSSFPKHYRDIDKSPEIIFNDIKDRMDSYEFDLMSEHALQMSSIIKANFIENYIISSEYDINEIYWTSLDDKEGQAGDHEKLTGINDPLFDGDIIIETKNKKLIGISAKYGNTKSPTLKNPGCNRLDKIFNISLKPFMDKHIQNLYDLGYSGSNDQMKDDYKKHKDSRKGLEARRSGLETRHSMIHEIYQSLSRMSSDELRTVVVELCAPRTHTQLYRSHTHLSNNNAKHYFNHAQQHVLDTLEQYSRFDINKEFSNATSVSIYGYKKFDNFREPVMTITIKFKSGPLKDWGGKITCPMLNKKEKKRVLYAFDLDETLFHYDTYEGAKIYVRNRENASLVHTLTNKQFNDYVLETENYFDYSQFESSEIFAKTAKPIQKILDKMIKCIAENKKVEIVTARSDFNNKELFLNTLQNFGINTSKIHIRRCGNLRNILTSGKAKQYVFKELIRDWKYEEIHFWDDNLSNIDYFLKLKDHHPELKLIAYHVNYNNDKLKVKKHVK
jgi:hypothetical protein